MRTLCHWGGVLDVTCGPATSAAYRKLVAAPKEKRDEAERVNVAAMKAEIQPEG